MKKILSFLLKAILFFVVGFFAFFFWASSSNLEESEYEKSMTLDVENVTKNDSLFTIATYNIGYLSGMTNNTAKARPRLLFDSNLTKVQEVIESSHIDILALQEIDYASSRSHFVDQQKALAEMGYANVAQAINWDKKYVPFPKSPWSAHFGKVVSGQSILSKFPIMEHQRIILDKVERLNFFEAPFYLDRLAQVATILIDNRPVKVINVHTEAFDQETRMKHLNRLADLYKKYASDHPTILLGDFNSEPKEETLLKDIIMSIEGIDAAVNDLNEGTFPSIDPTRRIDFIFYNKRFIEAISSRVITEVEDASDHLPVMMTFRLKK
ncbi:endonuclease/exonuclease/phosphatase family protein [Sungkyunkwania multivorans]|uniref:Endonuclease/exonuclease/phosphatase family protein n=1 Tax=Sungkyunkwania multivorans TaxID=1173618 RepID=A0ABW3CWK2_9FLAO